MKAKGQLYGCPVELALDLIGGKWKIVILARLKESSMRYADLRRLIPTLSDKMLTQRLHELEAADFIERREDSDASRYALTGHGRSLQPALQALYSWGEAVAPRNGARFRPVGDAS